MSGTPLQNRHREIFSYLAFLRHPPYNIESNFDNLFKNVPLGEALRTLGLIIRPLMLRRIKESRIDGELIIPLPPRSALSE